MAPATYTVIYSELGWTDRLVADIVATSDADDSVVVFRRRSEVSDLAEGRAQNRGSRYYDGWTSEGLPVTVTTTGRYEPTSDACDTFTAHVAARPGGETPYYLEAALGAAARALCARPCA